MRREKKERIRRVELSRGKVRRPAPRMADLAGSMGIWCEAQGEPLRSDLRLGVHALATLRLHSSIDTGATAECAEGRWSIARSSTSPGGFDITAAGLYAPTATFARRHAGFGGPVRFFDERRYELRVHPTFVRLKLARPDGTALLRLRIRGIRRLYGELETAEEARGVFELPILVFLLWHAAVVLHREYLAVDPVVAGPHL